MYQSTSGDTWLENQHVYVHDHLNDEGIVEITVFRDMVITSPIVLNVNGEQ